MPGTFDVPVGPTPDAAGRPAGHFSLLAGRESRLLGGAALGVAVAAVAGVWLVGRRPPDPGDLLAIAMVVVAVALGGLTVARERAMAGMAAALQAERSRVVDLEHRLELAVGVDAAVRAFSASVELDQVADAVLAEALTLLDAADGALLLVDDQGRLLLGATHRLDLPADHDERVIDQVNGSTGWVASHCSSLLLSRPTSGEELAGMAPGPLESAIAVPLLAGDQLVGILSVGTDERGRRFDQGDLFLLELLADHAALACSNANHLADQRASLVAMSEADRRRSDQIAMITHDLKTPLTSLIGYLNLLRKRGERGSSVDRSTFYKHMDRAARRMLEMVEDLLVSTRLECDGQALKREPLDLPALVEETRSLFAGRAPDRQIEVTADPVVAPVYGDRSAIAHILQNLVDNALKYSPAGSPVKVDVEDQPTQVLLTVSDDGDGIPDGERSGIFERFHRATRSGPRGSVGLGLHVVKSLVAAHGGRVWCESQPGIGSRFYVTLPRRAAAEPGIAVASAAEPRTVEPRTVTKGPT